MLFLGDGNGLKYCFPTFMANSPVKIFFQAYGQIKEYWWQNH